MWYTYICPPLIGAVIGYFTNDLAIRMLFRPHYPKYLFGYKVPFTPGLIPKEKARLSQSIGEAVSINLMNQEVLSKNLLSDEMLAKIAQGLDSFYEKQKENEDTVRSYVERFISPEELNSIYNRVNEGFSHRLSEKISESDFGDQIAQKVVEYVMEKMGNGMMGFLGADKLMAPISDKLSALLSKHLNVILKENGPEFIDTMVKGQIDVFLDSQVSHLLKGKETQFAEIKQMIISFYKKIITDHLPHVLATIDIKKIIEDRINEMEVAEMEELIMQVMKKELRYIVWLGALLGGILGLFNLLLMTSPK